MEYKICIKCNRFTESFIEGSETCVKCTSYFKRRTPKIILLFITALVISGCVAKSKFVDELSKNVKDIAINHENLVDALDQNGILPKEQTKDLKQNAKIVTNSTTALAEKSSSLFSFDSIMQGLNTLAKITDDVGSYFGLPKGTVEKGIALLTLIGGFIEHKRRIKKEKIKTRIVSKLPPQNAKDYENAEKEVLLETKKGLI